MKNRLLLITFILISLSLVALAEPTWSPASNEQSVRPGTSGSITISVQNIDPVNERFFEFCIVPASSIQGISGSCDSSITYLNTGQSDSVTLSYSVANEVQTPSSQPITLTISYEYANIAGGWSQASYTKSSYVSVAGISIKDEANQKIIQLGTLISSVQNMMSTAQTSLTTAQNMISSAEQQNKDVSIANTYLSSSQENFSSAQNYLTNAQNEYSQAQSQYASTSYQGSLVITNQAITDIQNANTSASNSNQAALQAQTAATNATCMDGYTLQNGQCVSSQFPPINNGLDESDNTLIYATIAIIVVLGIIAVIYVWNRGKDTKKKQNS